MNRLFTANQIIINPRCKKLINDLGKVTWKNNKLDEGPQKKLTHISDCLGYFLWREFNPSLVVKKIHMESR